MVAALIAATRPEINVAKVVTVSGNLDHQAWTAYHRLPPLSDSLNLPDYMASFPSFRNIIMSAATTTISLLS